MIHEATHPVSHRVLEDGTVVATSVHTPKSFVARAEVVIPPRRIIPVVFVPGVMGSCLKVRAGREVKVQEAYRKARLAYTPRSWTPNNGKSMLYRMSSYPPALRQVVLDKDNVEVDGDNEVDVGDLNLSKEQALERGWGEIMWDGAYGPIIHALEKELGRFMYSPGCGVLEEEKRLTDWWKDMHHAGQRVPGPFFDNPESSPRISPVPAAFALSVEDIKRMGAYRFPVHAFGYNWLQSNADSGKKLKQRIEEIVRGYAEARGPGGKPAFTCRQVILVTHSMGGLVARMASKLLKNEGREDLILGIIHGEMPALGAPVMYRRMACGFESSGGMASWGFSRIMGATAAESMPVLAFSPAALQLAPTPDYPGAWLFANAWNNDRGLSEQILALPAKGDPYNEIFLARGKWYCPAVESMLDPAKMHGHPRSPWDDYSKAVKDAELFHRGGANAKEKAREKDEHLGHYYHPNTYVHYGDDPWQATFRTIQWSSATSFSRQLKALGKQDPYASAPLASSNGREERQVEVPVPAPGNWEPLQDFTRTWGRPMSVPNLRQAFACTTPGEPLSGPGPGGSGDGTVPAESGSAPGRFGLGRIYKLQGFDHQGAYEHPATHGATFFAIANLVKKLREEKA